MKAASATVAAMTHGFTFGFQICSVMARALNHSIVFPYGTDLLTPAAITALSIAPTIHSTTGPSSQAVN
jgi:hypothetical protein